ncbi:hypothetical protein BXY66_3898 [Shimia isoporae]|uniref:Copper chaperone PCu(A)C n=1 Tax=Shimia isoporae TaxID=647720 RepID=A0A4R1N0J8_9RHOB|nr:hypothetical protein [Shimia isoporae]TCK99396.1 hypothetical protein BXY66_3898 [Shimia isoporae]
MISRRTLLVWGLVVPATGIAHEGHSHLQLKISADVVRVRGGVALVELVLFNTGVTAVKLRNVQVPGAEVLNFAVLGVPAGQITETRLKLKFRGAIPDIASLVLDFGSDGEKSVSFRF